eukprot:gnl/TRDRNA2_/TRDRNA2_85920_c0_seq1.p1 gnl/TRDRNA2_/TRDRNA2_85920_c0~~gnl/TRDRNA2_/TRDRNA2_85920_c0_seq1.p1  ORF type:complete len:564 (+),score=141.04 gnl/TRDRNA2_/TRDRNA2_85920_c0_seq1:70-1761(+)
MDDDDDGALLTPEAEVGGKREQEQLLTPESEREKRVRGGGSKGKASTEQPKTQPPAATASDGTNGNKRKAEEDANGPAKRTDSGLEGNMNNYRKIKKVGVGAYGSVFMAENTETKEIVAVKVTSRNEDPVLGGFPLSLLREIGILRKLSHDNIVKIHEVSKTAAGDPLIVMEFCQSSLQELLNSRKHGLSFSEVKYVIRQILDATNHMHEKGILHRDLATKNVLFNLSGEIKVCDFGISRKAFGQDPEYGFLPAKDLENPNMIVSMPYRAIELLLGDNAYGPALDVWSCGCILGEILLCQGGKRQTLFGGEPGNPNKTPQTTVEAIFEMLGKPTDETWPGFSKLSLLKEYAKTSARIEKAKAHKEVGEERAFLRKFFMSGDGQCATQKYSLTESCFDLMGKLLTLCPADRNTAREALTHRLFTDKPYPEWHAWHWALADKDISKADQMRKAATSPPLGDERSAQDLLREISKEEDRRKGPEKDPDTGKTLQEKTKEALLKRANDKKMAEEKKAAALKAAAEKKAAASEKLPPGWTKHFSASKQKYYYHDQKTGQNRWDPPPKR